MLTFEQLIRTTPSKIVRYSDNCTTFLIRNVYDMDELGIPHKKYLIKSRDNTTPDRTRKKWFKGEPKRPKKTKIITVRLYGKSKNHLKNKIWVHCSCEYFRFLLEIVLAQHGSSSVISCAKTHLPMKTNPKLKPHLCKHVMAAINKIKGAKFDESYLSTPIPTEDEVEELLKRVNSR
jgi:hypothetical protein